MLRIEFTALEYPLQLIIDSLSHWRSLKATLIHIGCEWTPLINVHWCFQTAPLNEPRHTPSGDLALPFGPWNITQSAQSIPQLPIHSMLLCGFSQVYCTVKVCDPTTIAFSMTNLNLLVLCGSAVWGLIYFRFLTAVVRLWALRLRRTSFCFFLHSSHCFVL